MLNTNFCATQTTWIIAFNHRIGDCEDIKEIAHNRKECIYLQICNKINGSMMWCPTPELLSDFGEEDISDGRTTFSLFFFAMGINDTSPLHTISNFTIFPNPEFFKFQEPKQIRLFRKYFPYNTRHIEIKVRSLPHNTCACLTILRVYVSVSSVDNNPMLYFLEF